MAIGGYRVQLDLRPVSKLRPHEETIESNTREMVAQLEKDGIQKDPIIIDGDSGVVLDGMHRLSAFIQLGIGYAACCPVDYGAGNINVGRWLRIYTAPGNDRPSELAKAAGLAQSKSASDAMRLLEEKETQVAAFAGGGSFLPSGSQDIDGGFASLRTADAYAQSHGWRRTFARESDFEEHVRNPAELILMVRRFDKEEVLKAGMVGHLFPCKTSLHALDPRPVAVNVPLKELREGSKETLARRLQEKRFEMMPPDSVYEGRKYKERLLLLSGR